MSDWISVRERMPELFTDVLVVYRWHDQMGKAHSSITIATRNETSWRDDEYEIEVTHWRELPELPGEGE